MGLERPEDRELYRAWKQAVAGMTSREVARQIALAAGSTAPDERTVRNLMRAEPSRFADRTREALRAFLATHPQRVSSVREAASQPYQAGAVTQLSDNVRVWVQRFLLRLTEAGVPEDEIDSARRLLTKSDVISYAHGGAPGMGALDVDQQLRVVKLIAAEVIIPRLKELGRKVSASLAR